MILNPVKSVQAFLAFSALALFGVAGCGSEAGTKSVGQPSAETPAETTLHPLGTARGTYKDGHLSFSPVKGLESKPGVKLQGFGPAFTQSLVDFATAVGDGVGTGSCSATQYCATVAMTNNTGVPMQNVWVEITLYEGIDPPGSPISWAGSPFTLSGSYASAFVNSGNVEAASYGDFTAGQTKLVEFKFNVGTATDFYFNASVLATFTRNLLSGSFYAPSGLTTDACAGGTLITAADDAEVDIALPFPHTAMELTSDRAVVGSNGYFLLYRTGNTPPTLGASGTNLDIYAAGFPRGYYLFWDDLAFDSGDGVCVSVTGSKPYRLFTITWKNARIDTTQPTKAVFSTEKITYSLTLQETSDQVGYHYALPSGGITNLTRGGSASLGAYYQLNGVDFVYTYGFNTPTGFTPASPASYPTLALFDEYPRNP